MDLIFIINADITTSTESPLPSVSDSPSAISTCIAESTVTSTLAYSTMISPVASISITSSVLSLSRSVTSSLPSYSSISGELKASSSCSIAIQSSSVETLPSQSQPAVIIGGESTINFSLCLILTAQ